jgi:hypothetical protein
MEEKEKIQVVKGIARLGFQDWKYFCRKKDMCLFRNDDDEIIQIEKKNLNFVQDESGKSYSIRLLTNRNRKHEKEKREKYFDQFEVEENPTDNAET